MCSCAQSPNDCAINFFLSMAIYFNEAQFFQSDPLKQKRAASAMYMIMRLLRLVAFPALVVVIVMVSQYSILIIYVVPSLC